MDYVTYLPSSTVEILVWHVQEMLDSLKMKQLSKKIIYNLYTYLGTALKQSF